jgi:hypothetical protein
MSPAQPTAIGRAAILSRNLLNDEQLRAMGM